ncbi:uncharacterized protein FYW61_015556 [Anableps anableps]
MVSMLYNADHPPHPLQHTPTHAGPCGADALLRCGEGPPSLWSLGPPTKCGAYLPPSHSPLVAGERRRVGGSQCLGARPLLGVILGLHAQGATGCLWLRSSSCRSQVLGGRETMFKSATKAVVKALGAKKTLICSKNSEEQLDLLTLVRIKHGFFWNFPTYKVLKCTLPELVGDEEFSPDFEEKVLMKDFKTCIKTGGSIELDGGHKAVAEAELSVEIDVVDTIVQPVTIKAKTTDLKSVEKKFRSRTINKNALKRLNLGKKDQLAFVYERAYNTAPVTLTRKGTQQGCFKGSHQNMANLCFSGNNEEDTEFTVPENSTIAYSLVEIKLEDGEIGIPAETWTHKRGLVHDAIDSSIMEKVKEGIDSKENLLKPIAKLPESTRGDLLKRLREVLEEEDALSELEDTLDQSHEEPRDPPEYKTVSSFMDLLDEPERYKKVKDALFLLVSAMNGESAETEASRSEAAENL